jgi:hypothetical protein
MANLYEPDGLSESDNIERVVDIHNRLRSGRTSLNSKLDQIAEVMYPQRRGFSYEVQPGQELSRYVMDMSAAQDLSDMATAAEYLLMPRSETWFDIDLEDDADDEPAEEWALAAASYAWRSMYNPRSGYSTAIPVAFLDMCAFGFNCLFAGRNASFDGMSYRSIHPSYVQWTYDADMNHESTYVCMPVDGAALARKYGIENLHEDHRSKLRDGDYFKIDVLHAVEPDRQSMNGEFNCWVIDEKNRKLLTKYKYRYNPYIVSVWFPIGDNNVWSIGRSALPEVAVLQEVARTILKAGQRAVDPPLLVPNDAIVGKFRNFPGGVSTYDVNTMAGRQGNVVDKIDIAGNIPVGLDIQQDRRAGISRIFLGNVTRLPEKYMSATEVSRYNEDLLRLSQSPFGRLEGTFSYRVVDNTFSVALQDSVDFRFNKAAGSPFGPPPPALQNRDVAFKFNSPLSRAREMARLGRLNQVLNMLAPILAADPSGWANFDTDSIVRTAVRAGVGMAPDFLRSQDEVDATRQQTNALATAGQAAQVADVGSRAVRNVAQAGTMNVDVNVPGASTESTGAGSGMAEAA